MRGTSSRRGHTKDLSGFLIGKPAERPGVFNGILVSLSPFPEQLRGGRTPGVLAAGGPPCTRAGATTLELPIIIHTLLHDICL